MSRTSPRGNTHGRVTKPPRWEAGSRIGVVSAASATLYDLPDRARRAKLNLEEFLSGVVVSDMQGVACGYSAATPRAVADQLHGSFADPRIRLIVSAIGGFTTNRVLRELDWDLLKRNPTLICGYSDTTALLLAILKKTGQSVLHGPAFLPQWGDPRGPFPESRAAFLAAISPQSGPWPIRAAPFWVSPRTNWSDPTASVHRQERLPARWRVLVPGVAGGPLMGGNIETINILVGTDYLPSFRDSVFFFEATGPEAHLPRLHRALIHLRDSGALEGIRGLIVGRCPDAVPHRDVSLSDVVLDVFANRDIPIVGDVDCGHSEPILTLPIGCNAVLQAVNGDAKLIVQEAAVS